MKLLWMLLLSTVCCAQTFTYYGFTGLSPDVYTTATSNDGTTWTNAGGVWPGVEVNSPAALYYRGDVYLLLATSTDGVNTRSQILIGKIDANKSVSTIMAYDFRDIFPNVQSVFAGRWIVDSSSVIHIFVPVALNPANRLYNIYEMHALTADLTTWSVPVLITVTGTPPSVYDPDPFQVGNTFYLYTTSYVSGSGRAGFGANTCLSQASSLLGPYAEVSCATNPADNLYPLNSFPWEGPNSYHLDSASTWQFYAENITPLAENTATCSGPNPATCTLATPAAWTSPGFTYRSGTILRNPGKPQGMLAAVGAN